MINHLEKYLNKKSKAKSILLWFGAFIMFGITFTFFYDSSFSYLPHAIATFFVLIGLMIFNNKITKITHPKLTKLSFVFASMFFFIFLYAFIIFIVFELNIIPYPIFSYSHLLSYKIKFVFFTSLAAAIFYTAQSLHYLYSSFQLSIDRYNHLIKGYKNEIDELRMQSNPYFMHNYLINTSKLLKQGNLSKALEYNTAIGALVHKRLVYTQSKFISLEEEILWLKDYISAEHILSENEFTYEIYAEDDDVYLQHIPPLLLKPIIENYIDYSRLHHESRIAITIKIYSINNDKGIKIQICNTTSLNANKSLHKNLAIINLEKRIHLINKLNAFSIQLHSILIDNKSTYELIITEN